MPGSHLYRVSYMRIVRVSNESDQLLSNLIEARAALATAQEQLTYSEGQLLDYMEANQEKTVVFNEDGKQYTATYTQRTSNVINEIGLRKALRAPVYDRYTKKVLDRKALAQAMSDGEVDPEVVAKFWDPVPGVRYLTFRVKDEDEVEGL